MYIIYVLVINTVIYILVINIPCFVYMMLLVYILIYIQVTTINEKGGHGFEKEQREVYRQVWREKGEGRNYVIAL